MTLKLACTCPTRVPAVLTLAGAAFGMQKDEDSILARSTRAHICVSLVLFSDVTLSTYTWRRLSGESFNTAKSPQSSFVFTLCLSLFCVGYLGTLIQWQSSACSRIPLSEYVWLRAYGSRGRLKPHHSHPRNTHSRKIASLLCDACCLLRMTEGVCGSRLRGQHG